MFYEQEPRENEASARQFLSVLMAHRRLVFWTAVITLVAMAYYTFTRPETYRATARILIEPKKPEALHFSDADSDGGEANRDYYETQYQLLRDKQLAERVLERLKASGHAPAPPASPVDTFARGIRVIPLKKSRLVDVGYEHTDPVWAARVANTLVETYIEESQQRDFGASERVLLDLTKQAEELEAKLQASHAALQQFRQESDVVGLDESDNPSSIALGRLARLEEAVTQAQIKRLILEAEDKTTRQLAAGDEQNAEVDPLVDDETLRILRVQLAQMQQERAKLAIEHLDNHPTVLAVECQIAAIKDSILKESQRILATRSAEFEQVTAEEVTLKAACEAQKNEVQKIGQLTASYAILKMETDRCSRLYDAVLERIREIDLVSELARGGTNVFFIQKAQAPTRAIKPNTRVNFALALLLGPVLGIGLALVAHSLDTSLKSKQEIEEALSLPILGFVPPIKLAGGKKSSHAYLVGLRHPGSHIAETFRTICASMIRGHGGVMARRIVVTSAAAREGKTMVAANLAAAMARGGERVLLVDADLRRPSLLKIFDIRIWATLKNYLRPVGDPVTFNEVVYSTGLKNLDVLPCERPGDNPADLLSSPGMKQLVRDAMCLYDRIVFDAPPCLGIADAGILAADADATILVVRAFETPKHLAQRAREVLEGLANNLIGVVVNDMDAGRRGAYYARGDYYGRYHYDPDASANNDVAAAGSAREKPCTVA